MLIQTQVGTLIFNSSTEINLRYLKKPLIKREAPFKCPKTPQTFSPDVPRGPPVAQSEPPDAPSEPPHAPSGPPH